MSFVLDRSVTLSWCFEDERLEATDALLKQVVESGAEAPSLWPLEILSALSIWPSGGGASTLTGDNACAAFCTICR